MENNGKITYQFPRRLRRSSRVVIQRANDILEEYAAQGFVLTLRMLYYKFVARGFLKNTQRNYKRLGGIIGKARLMGRLSWDGIEDRTRWVRDLQKFAGPQDALDKLAEWYHVDMWKNQAWRPEVWVEKDAVSGIIAGVCEENDVPWFSCRGYTSLSEMWRASERLKAHAAGGQKPFIIHFGDHDPSGIDMSRDITERLQQTFMAGCDFVRAALTMEQVREFNPPPNPAKVTDSRYKVYVEKYGDESWELDALEPAKFRELVLERIEPLKNKKRWKADAEERERVREQLKGIGREWKDIAANKERLETMGQELAAAQTTIDGQNGSISDLHGRVAKLRKELAEKRKK